jgi:ERCC4-related helicase
VSPPQHDPKDSHARLYPHQVALVETFFNPASQRILLLRSDAGLGATTALVVVMRRLLRERPQARVLFLAPSRFRSQIFETLCKLDVPSQLVDRYRFREMVESTTREGLWPRGVALVLSQDFARQPDIQGSLAETHWDLVIATEAHWLRGIRAEAFRRIISHAERVVLATIPGLELPEASPAENVTEVLWRRDKVVDQHGRRLHAAQRPVLHEIAFSLTPAELRLRRMMVDLCGEMRGRTEVRNLVAKVLLGQMHSSPAALESALQRVIERSEVQSSIDEELGLEELGGDIPDDGFADQMVRANDESVTRLATHVLRGIDTITTDSKLAAFGQLLRILSERALPYRRVCVLTDYLATLYYLAADIEGKGMICHLIYGAMSTEDRRASLASFVDEGGVLVATRAAVVGGDHLGEVTDIILYDLPGSEISFRELLSRFDRFGRTRQLTIHALTPSNEADCLASERITLLRKTLHAFADGG